MQVDIDTLMTWARAHAPYPTTTPPMRRRVLLEIAAERTVNTHTRRGYGEIIIACVYLAEPRCFGTFISTIYPPTTNHEYCECGPIAEMRIG
jgi:hypothetical protein